MEADIYADFHVYRGKNIRGRWILFTTPKDIGIFSYFSPFFPTVYIIYFSRYCISPLFHIAHILLVIFPAVPFLSFWKISVSVFSLENLPEYHLGTTILSILIFHRFLIFEILVQFFVTFISASFERFILKSFSLCLV